MLAASASATGARFTTLFANDTLARVERLRIQTKRRFTEKSRGEHRSRGGGRSLEFKDYRDYVAGDDVRFLDWNIFARLRRPFVKLFHDEEEQWVVVLIDASASMGFEDKLERARAIAAAFGIMGLLAGERVTAHAFNARGAGNKVFKAPRGRAGLQPWLRFCEGITAGGDAPLEDGIATLLRTHRGRGVLVVVSDFLSAADLRGSFNHALAAGLEILALQVLAPSEIEPSIDADLRLVDSETARHLDVTAAGDLLALYREHKDAFVRRVAEQVKSRAGRHVLASSAESTDDVLFTRLRRAGWVA